MTKYLAKISRNFKTDSTLESEQEKYYNALGIKYKTLATNCLKKKLFSIYQEIFFIYIYFNYFCRDWH